METKMVFRLRQGGLPGNQNGTAKAEKRQKAKAPLYI